METEWNVADRPHFTSFLTGVRAAKRKKRSECTARE